MLKAIKATSEAGRGDTQNLRDLPRREASASPSDECCDLVVAGHAESMVANDLQMSRRSESLEASEAQGDLEESSRQARLDPGPGRCRVGRLIEFVVHSATLVDKIAS